KTIGVAVSYALKITAQGLTTIYWDENDMSSADKALSDIIEQHEVSEIVVGLPKHMNGSLGERGEISQIYARRLERIFNLTVHLLDERLTTVAAVRWLLVDDLIRRIRCVIFEKMVCICTLTND